MHDLVYKINGIDVAAPTVLPTGGLPETGNIINLSVNILLISAIVLTLFGIIFSGMQWILSQGDAEKIEEAKKRLFFSIVGLIIVLLAYFIVNFIGNFFGVNLLGTSVTPTPMPTIAVDPTPTSLPTNTPVSTIFYPSPTPISSTPVTCHIDDGVPMSPGCACGPSKYIVTCERQPTRHCVALHYDPSFPAFSSKTGCDAQAEDWCEKSEYTGSGQGTYCVGKPVIYLYPTRDTLVDVSLAIPGTITKSIPHYPEGGWRSVLAHPDGRLEYQGKQFTELFYESTVSHVLSPTTGIIIPKKNLPVQLSDILYRLGLHAAEQQEFLDFWVPKLQALPGNYIQFSLFDKATKEHIDGVYISPEPDTRIELLVYFKPLALPVAIDPLVLPQTPPKRIGFSEVEWGGTIDGGDTILY